ncbi:hypothetical protein PR048_012342 [Dryococelus australis]|uniref:Uncharacterized protein n=1 Tax=Dryococelus australis TaxID=614101 RepID=A0ABQ9HQE0_9NEOP|nr:hypothetical protein PR048_012342 [Dryococelus australis]
MAHLMPLSVSPLSPLRLWASNAKIDPGSGWNTRLPLRGNGLDSRRGRPGYSHVGIGLDDGAGRLVFSEISRFPGPLHSGAAPYSSRFTLTTRLSPRRTCSIPCRVAPGFSHVGIVPDNAADRRVSLGIYQFPHPLTQMLFRTHPASPSSALKTWMLRAAQISSLTPWATHSHLSSFHVLSVRNLLESSARPQTHWTSLVGLQALSSIHTKNTRFHRRRFALIFARTLPDGLRRRLSPRIFSNSRAAPSRVVEPASLASIFLHCHYIYWNFQPVSVLTGFLEAGQAAEGALFQEEGKFEMAHCPSPTAPDCLPVPAAAAKQIRGSKPGPVVRWQQSWPPTTIMHPLLQPSSALPLLLISLTPIHLLLQQTFPLPLQQTNSPVSTIHPSPVQTLPPPIKTIVLSHPNDGNTARIARRSDEALEVRVSVAYTAPSLLDLERAATQSS